MTTQTVGSDALSTLNSALEGEALGPSDDGWDVARQAWNLAADQRPAAVAVAAGVADIQAVIRFAGEHGLRVAAQASGHAAGGIASLDGTILLRTGRLDGARIDTDARIARLEAGVLTAELAAAAGEHGLAPLSGSSPDVGAAGFTLLGGLGWLGRRYGLACNSARAFEVVTADGELVRADRESEPDLFWALRGGGGSFGVVTALEVELQPISEVYAGAVLYDVEHAPAVLRAHRDWAGGAPREVTSSVRFLSPPPVPHVPEPIRGRALVGITAAHLGSVAEAADELRSLRELAEPVLDSFAVTPAAALCRIHGDPEAPVPGVADHVVLAELPDEAVDTLVSLAGAGSDSPLLQVDLRQLGGALGEGRDDAGALAALPGAYALAAVGAVMDPAVAEPVSAHLDRLASGLAPWSTGRAYLNFRDRPRDPADAFEPGVYSRLREVKARMDPENLFRANHEIPPAG
jgi:FAD/FMN-containing dehydrogenase